MNFESYDRRTRFVVIGAARACFDCDCFTRNGGPCPGLKCEVPDAVPGCYADVAADRFGSLARRDVMLGVRAS